MTARSRHDELRALADFVDASVAVWRSIDDREALPGGYGAQPLTSDTELRKTERAAWERYRAVMDRDGDVLLGLLGELAAAEARAAELERELREKKQELAVAYGSGRSDDETEWFSALDAMRARAVKAEQALRELKALIRDPAHAARMITRREINRIIDPALAAAAGDEKPPASA